MKFGLRRILWKEIHFLFEVARKPLTSAFSYDLILAINADCADSK